MSARTRLSSAVSITLAVAVSTSTALLLTGCDPTDTAAAPAGTRTVAATPTGKGPAMPAPVPTGKASPTVAPTGKASPTVVLNGTAHSRLTISNGTDHVLMNGTSVDFGTVVRDLAWSPDGAKAAFINGSGDLVVSNPDGNGRVVVAKNPGGQTWSHPTWQVAAADPTVRIPAKNNLFLTVSQGGVSRLEGVPATAVNGTPKTLGLGAGAGENVPELPQTGNAWPNAGGIHGTVVYANTNGDVYIRDDYLRQEGGAVTKGSQPALAPDGSAVVFVRASGGHDHLFEQSLQDRSAPKDLTPNATTDYTEPAWSPDGRTIAVRTPDGISTVPADGSAAPTQVSTYPGLPAYRG